MYTRLSAQVYLERTLSHTLSLSLTRTLSPTLFLTHSHTLTDTEVAAGGCQFSSVRVKLASPLFRTPRDFTGEFHGGAQIYLEGLKIYLEGLKIYL